jgi:diguanylate cyclase (GGDEF)-like protein
MNRPAPPDDLSGKVDALLAMRLRDLRLPPDIMALYRERTRKSAMYMMFNWCIALSVVVLVTSAFDVQPPGYGPLNITLRLAISAMFLASAYAVRLRLFRNREYYPVIASCLLMLAIGGVFGVAVHDPSVVDGRLNMGIVAISTGIFFLRIDNRALLSLAASSTLLTAFFIAGWGENPVDSKIQLIVFYALTMCGTLYARKIQDTHLYQSFLVNTREEIRAKAALDRGEALSEIAYVDKLTDLPNRRYFDEICDSMSDTTENLFPLALCMADIDHFKLLNDALGHLQGDRCLNMVAAAMRNSLRGGSDILARYGGEEFILLLPNTFPPAALEVVERMRAAVFNLGHPNPGSPVKVVTASFGVALVAAPPLRIEELIAQADAALYRAKTQGRNRVVGYPAAVLESR